MIQPQSKHGSIHASFVLTLLVLSGCTSVGAPSDAARNAPEPPAAPTPSSKPTPKRAWLLSSTEAPVPLEAFTIRASTAVLKQALEENGCAEIITGAGAGAGPDNITLESGSRVSHDLVDCASAELANRPAPSSTLRIAVGAPNSADATCVVELPTPKLQKLTLRSRPEGARLEWVVSGTANARSGIRVATGDIDSDAATAGLLLPAVQKVAVTPLPDASATEDGYALYLAGATRPSFEVPLDDANAQLFFPLGGRASPPRTGLIEVAGSRSAIAFVLDLEDLTFGEGRLRGSTKPPIAVLEATPSAPSAESEARVASLLAAAPTTLDQTTAPRLIGLLDGRPSEANGDLVARRRALIDYWSGSDRRTTLDAGLSTFIARASDEEGLWAYARLPATARLFAKLDPYSTRAIAIPSILRSRILAGAALAELEHAGFPMSVRTAHDYTLAFAAVARLGEASSLLVGAPSGALESIIPEEIDLAVAVAAESAASTSAVIGAASRFGASLDVVLGAAEIGDADLARLEQDAAALHSSLTALDRVTALRFKVSRGR